jgi:hypothetical protein
MFVVVLILGGIVVLTRPMQPARMDVVHAAGSADCALYG